MLRACRSALFFCLVFVCVRQAAAQSDADSPHVEPYIRDVTRVESWSFFQPFEGGGNPTYSFVGNRATLGVRVKSVRFDLDGAFQYAQLVGVPERAVGPNALGSGGFYFFQAGSREAYQLYFKAINVRIRELVPGLSVTAGRMGFSSGEERASSDALVEELKHLRLGSRMVGEFEWSIFQRAFDGGRVDLTRRTWSANASLLFPTQGTYEESANPTISSVRVLAASVTLNAAAISHQELQLFAYHYRDRRDVRGRPDNRGPLRDLTHVSIATFGGSHVGAFPRGSGRFDTLLWIAGQTGDWYGQPHRALSGAAEGGYRFAAPARPWIRGGLLYASGDRSPSDDRHETFFPMLPSLQRYALSTTYAPMNLRDVFAQAFVQPAARLRARADVHQLSLANAADRWYHGSGAASRTGTFFGFSGRPSNAATSLARVIEGTLDVSMSRVWSLNGYVGWMKGGEVVRRLFAGDRLVFGYVESVIGF